MIGLHEGALLLIFGLKRRLLLAQGLRRCRNVGRLADRPRRPVSSFGGNTARGCRRQRLVECNQRFTLEGIGVASVGLAVRAHSAGADDALLLGISDQ